MIALYLQAGNSIIVTETGVNTGFAWKTPGNSFDINVVRAGVL